MNERYLRIHIGLLLLGALGVAPEARADEPSEPRAEEQNPELAYEVEVDPRRAIDARTAIRLALENSPTLRVAEIEKERAKWGVTAEEGRYQFLFEADTGYTQGTNPRLQTGNEVSSNTSRSFILGGGFSRTFATGTVGRLRFQGERFSNEFGGGFINPILNQASGYGATARLTLSQPLLRGAGTRIGEVELRAAESNRVYTEKSERRVMSQLIRDVLLAYGELWYASEALAIEEKALELARAQERDAEARVERGALAPVDALSFSTRVAELEEAVVAAETNQKTRALELLRITGAGRSLGSESWVASAPPEETDIPARAVLETALRTDSVELAELEAQVETARVRAEVAGDALRPKLDVEGYIESRGLGEDPASALSRAGQMGWVTGHIGLTLELPLGDSRKEAERASAQLSVSSAQANLQAARERISADAAIGIANAEAAQKRFSLAQRTRELSERSFEAEKSRYELGLSIPMQVQEADDNVRRARLREARARVDLASEQAQLEHLVGQLLDRFGS